jgi:hypothetical protein
MPAIDVLPQSSGGGAIEQRQASASSGGGGPSSAQLNSAGFSGYRWTPVPSMPKTDDNGAMEYRIARLETFADKAGERLAAIERDIAVVKSNYATREDVQSAKTAISDAKSSIIQWVVGAIILAQVLPHIPAIFKAFTR